MSTKKIQEVTPVEEINEMEEKKGLDRFFEMTKEQVEPLSFLEKETGKKYTIEFCRRTITEMAEEKSLSPDTFDDFDIFKRNELLFVYGLKMHHPEMTYKEAMRIFDDVLGGLTSPMIERITRLYFQGISSHLIVSEETMGKNSKVEIYL